MDQAEALIVILAFNEEESIEWVIRDVRDRMDAEILVVDDGSQDDTRDKALGAGARCISLAYNAGIGVAEQAGFMVAAQEGHRFIVRIDGDGQHDPGDLQVILDTLLEGDVDLVIGSRYIDGFRKDNGSMRRLGTRLLSWLVNRFTTYRITDATCGFRGYSRRAIEVFSEDYPDDFPEVEALMMSHRNGLRVREVPVNTLRRECGKSVIRPGVAVYYMSKVTLALMVARLRDLIGDGDRW